MPEKQCENIILYGLSMVDLSKLIVHFQQYKFLHIFQMFQTLFSTIFRIWINADITNVEIQTEIITLAPKSHISLLPLIKHNFKTKCCHQYLGFFMFIYLFFHLIDKWLDSQILEKNGIFNFRHSLCNRWMTIRFSPKGTYPCKKTLMYTFKCWCFFNTRRLLSIFLKQLSGGIFILS